MHNKTSKESDYMTHTDYTKKILNIKDKNIYFEDDCLEIKKIKGIQTKIFHGYLTYIPDYCPKCGCINEGFNDIIKWNFKKNCKIKLTKVSNYNTLLLLDKQRFLCKHCNHTFTASTDIVDFHKQIPNDTRKSVTLDLMTKDSEKNISFRNGISTNSTNRILYDLSKDELDKTNKKYSKNFNKEISQYDIVQYLINTDTTLNYVYNLYQGIIKSITKRDKEKFLNIIHNVDNKKLNKYTKQAIKTFLNFESYIINAFDYELSNGIVEGTNNVIKQVMHNACGYRKFTHLKTRIMLIKGIYNPLITQ